MKFVTYEVNLIPIVILLITQHVQHTRDIPISPSENQIGWYIASVMLNINCTIVRLYVYVR